MGDADACGYQCPGGDNPGKGAKGPCVTFTRQGHQCQPSPPTVTGAGNATSSTIRADSGMPAADEPVPARTKAVPASSKCFSHQAARPSAPPPPPKTETNPAGRYYNHAHLSQRAEDAELTHRDAQTQLQTCRLQIWLIVGGLDPQHPHPWGSDTLG